MNTGEWIGLITLIVTMIVGLGQLMFAWRNDVNNKKNADPVVSGNATFKKIELEWRVPKWLLRLALVLIQFTAIYFTVEQYNNVEEVTRSSVVIIAGSVGVWVLTFVLQQIIGVYDFIEAHYK